LLLHKTRVQVNKCITVTKNEKWLREEKMNDGGKERKNREKEKEEIAKENQYKRKKREKKVQGVTNDFDI